MTYNWPLSAAPRISFINDYIGLDKIVDLDLTWQIGSSLISIGKDHWESNIVPIHGASNNTPACVAKVFTLYL